MAQAGAMTMATGMPGQFLGTCLCDRHITAAAVMWQVLHLSCKQDVEMGYIRRFNFTFMLGVGMGYESLDPYTFFECF